MSEFGYYSTVLPHRRLRIISLNTNHAYLLNWWIFVGGRDPDNMLHWLVRELQAAEDEGQSVYILGHIPPGQRDVSRFWTLAFGTIVERYEATIVAQFYGHTHRDEVEILYDGPERERAISVAYLCPSITPFTNLNPGFRIYEVDDATNRIVNHYTWIMDLPASNRALKPIWTLEYDAKSAFNMQGLEVDDWHRWTVDLELELASNKTDGELMNKYLLFRRKSAAADMTKSGCDVKCRARMLCGIRGGKTFHPCPDLIQKYGLITTEGEESDEEELLC